MQQNKKIGCPLNTQVPVTAVYPAEYWHCGSRLFTCCAQQVHRHYITKFDKMQMCCKNDYKMTAIFSSLHKPFMLKYSKCRTKQLYYFEVALNT